MGDQATGVSLPLFCQACECPRVCLIGEYKDDNSHYAHCTQCDHRWWISKKALLGKIESELRRRQRARL